MDVQELSTNAEDILTAAIQKPVNQLYIRVGGAYYMDFEATHSQQALDNAIGIYKLGLSNYSGDTEDQVCLLNALGLAWSTKYELLGELEHLGNTLTCLSKATELCQLGNPNMPGYLTDLGNALFTRYERIGEMEDLERAMSCYEQALGLSPSGQPDRAVCLNGLANAALTRYERLGETDNLERAISCFKQALDLHPSGHSARSLSLNNLGNGLLARYQWLGEMEDLEKAIGCHEQALDLCPYDDPDKPAYLNNLANAVLTRYHKLGGVEDLQKTISCYKIALDLCPPGDLDRHRSLNNLGNALFSRYKQLGKMEDLENAISCHEETMELRPSGHPDRPSALSNLANALETRYKQLGEMEDLHKANFWYEKALNLCPSGHPLRSSFLNNTANAFLARYEQIKEEADLEKAISWYKEALDLYNQLGKLEDLEKTITWYEQALDLSPSGHSLRFTTLSNLGNALGIRHEQLGRVEDLHKAISLYKQGLDLRPPGHPDRSLTLNNLGYIYYQSYAHFENDRSLARAIDYHQQAANAGFHLPQMLIGAKQWALLAHNHEFTSATLAYSLAMNLLHQHLTVLPSLTSQQKLVEKSSHLSLDAAAWAIGNGTLEIAIEYLEQGRSILWSKIQGYRQPLKDISKKAPHLAEEFQEVSHKLEQSATSGSTDITLHHVQYERWTILLEKIRALDGFSNFLQATPFETLKNACAEGPVVLVNISVFRSDAIILVVDSPPMSIPLQDVTPQSLKKNVDQLKQAITSGSSQTTYHILQDLWDVIVQPVITQLENLRVPEKSHIWWCSTSYLCALPLHAAGPYKRGLKNLPDLYISSYTPTLTSLIKARSNIARHKYPLSLLLVSQPDDTIPQVFEEAKVIKSIKVQVDSFSGSNVDKQNVLKSLQSHTWVHFACHGHLEAQPFHSWFQLYKREHLTVLDLAGAQLPNAEFAFLSACHSAAGSIHGTPDESIHLAGALQVSGFKSVVGTLWAMVDDDGPPIADAFYRHIFHDLGNVDVRDTAKALNIATKELRRKKVPVNRWSNFIHLGA